MTSAPASAARASSASGGTPGETTTRSAVSNATPACPPAAHLDVEPARLGRQLAERRAVGADDARPALATQARGGDAALAETDDDHAFACEVHRHLSFSEESATSASRMEMIQKRTMMRGSGQPFFS